jgi:outer membrane protein OmpA-like peptidoglycan-associated protein
MQMQPRRFASADSETDQGAARSDPGVSVDAEGGVTATGSEGGVAVRAEAFHRACRSAGLRPGEAGLHPSSWFRAASDADAGGPNVTGSLFLSLILLVLAFFIVMVSISSFDAKRSADVIGSVAGAFASDFPRTPDLVSKGAQRGDVVDGEDLEQSLKRLFATELAVAEFRSVIPGRLLEIEMAGDVLFHREQARLRLTRSRLLDRLVATVTMRPLGQRVDVQGLVSTGTPDANDLPTSPSALAVRRAGAIGEGLTGRGLPRSRLAVGFWPGDHDRIVLVFSLSSAEGGSRLYAPATLGAAPGSR